MIVIDAIEISRITNQTISLMSVKILVVALVLTFANCVYNETLGLTFGWLGCAAHAP